MKKSTSKLKRFAAMIFVSVLLFCSTANTYASYNDERFEVYINMNNKVTKDYVIPNLYRQDTAYAYYKSFPVVVTGGVEYVPISAFSLFSYISVTYSKTSDNFYISNEKTKAYLSIDVTQNIAETNEGTIIDFPTKIFYQTRYIPARKTASVLGTVFCESYDNPKTGVYAFRIRDNAASLSFSGLLDRYVPGWYKEDPEPPEQPDPPETPDPPAPPTPPEQTDPYVDIAKRDMQFIFTDFNAQKLPEVLSTLKRYNQTVSFCLTYNDIYDNPEAVRTLYTSENPIILTLPETIYDLSTGKTTAASPLNAQQVSYELDKANNALYSATKQKVRLCYIPDSLIEGMSDTQNRDHTRNNFKEQLKSYGYAAIFTNCTPPQSYDNPYTVYNRVLNCISSDFDPKTAKKCIFEISMTNRSDYICALIFEFIRKYPQFTSSGADITSL